MFNFNTSILIPAALSSVLLISCNKPAVDTIKTDSTKSSTAIDTTVSGKQILSDSTQNKSEITKDAILSNRLKSDKDSLKSLKEKNIKNDSLRTQKEEKIRILAYYFHPTARCPTCINIENFTEEVIRTVFTKENKAGLITFTQLNIEDSVNEHYIEDYKLENSSVILAKFVNKKQVKWKNLEHVWKYAMDKESFFKYMKIEIKDFLKDKDGV